MNFAIFRRWRDIAGYSLFGLLGFPLGRMLSEASLFGKALGPLF